MGSRSVTISKYHCSCSLLSIKTQEVCARVWESLRKELVEDECGEERGDEV